MLGKAVAVEVDALLVERVSCNRPSVRVTGSGDFPRTYSSTVPPLPSKP